MAGEAWAVGTIGLLGAPNVLVSADLARTDEHISVGLPLLVVSFVGTSAFTRESPLFVAHCSLPALASVYPLFVEAVAFGEAFASTSATTLARSGSQAASRTARCTLANPYA